MVDDVHLEHRRMVLLETQARLNSRRVSSLSPISRQPVDAEGRTHRTCDTGAGSSALIIRWYDMCRPPVTCRSPVVHQQGGQEVWILGARSAHLKTVALRLPKSLSLPTP